MPFPGAHSLFPHFAAGSALYSATGRQYYHHDALGSTVNLTDAGGDEQVSYILDPWGHITGQTGTSVNRQIFTGQEHDEKTGLIYFGARYYDPDTARFMTQDTYLGEPGTPPSLHRYLYAYSNPTVYIDLMGYVSEETLEGMKQDESLFYMPNIIKGIQRVTGWDISDASVGFWGVFENFVTTPGFVVLESADGLSNDAKMRSDFYEKHPDWAGVIMEAHKNRIKLRNNKMFENPDFLDAFVEYGELYPSFIVQQAGMEKGMADLSREELIAGLNESFGFMDESVSFRERWTRTFNSVMALWMARDISKLGNFTKYELSADLSPNKMNMGLPIEIKKVTSGKLNPRDITFSQRTVSGNVDDYVKDMKAGNWDWERSGHIRIMKQDGKWVSYDNRRLLASQKAGLESIPYEVVDPKAIMPGSKKNLGTGIQKAFQ